MIGGAHGEAAAAATVAGQYAWGLLLCAGAAHITAKVNGDDNIALTITATAYNKSNTDKTQQWWV